MAASKQYLEDIKSKPGAPDARPRKVKLDLLPDREAFSRKMSKVALREWEKRKSRR